MKYFLIGFVLGWLILVTYPSQAQLYTEELSTPEYWDSLTVQPTHELTLGEMLRAEEAENTITDLEERIEALENK